MTRLLVALTAAIIVTVASNASAQTTAPFTVRGFADAGMEAFTASESFGAVFGASTGPLFGGGLDIVERHGLFAEVRASRFRRTGERVFVFNNERFRLGVPGTVTITPLELSVGYHPNGKRGVVPYAGGGVGWHRYTETSTFSQPGEDVSETFMGYHVLGGGEVRLWRWIAAAGELEWSTVPNSLGQDPDSVSSQFKETDLGGASFRFKIIIGR